MAVLLTQSNIGVATVICTRLWSSGQTSNPTIRIPLKPTVFSVKFVFEKNENKPK